MDDSHYYRSLQLCSEELFMLRSDCNARMEDAWAAVSKPRDGGVMSLLDELIDSVASSTASSFGGGGGGGQSHTRIPLNVAAVDLTARWVRDMTTMMDHFTDRRNPRVDIRESFRRLMLVATNHEAAEQMMAVAFDLGEFRRQVEAVLNPPRRVELRVACPECELPAAEYPFTVTLGTELLVARCKGCSASWVGEKQLRLLAGDVLDDKNFDSTGVLD
jgi:hypothetical protein